MVTIFIHGIKTNYLGDKACCPISYFNFPGHKCVMDIKRFRYPDPFLCPSLLQPGGRINFILGGGGLLRRKNLTAIKNISDLAKKYNGFSAIWSIGLNKKYKKNSYSVKPDLNKEWFSSFDFVGIRDFYNSWPYLPCSSCMIKFLDKYKNSSPIHNTIVYSHYRQPPILLKHDHPYPHMNNMETDYKKLENHIAFIASGTTVVTNSYHGAYWGMLMRRNVIVIPTSSRFQFFKYTPIIASYETWRKKLKSKFKLTPISYLDECRSLNTDFYKRVLGKETI
jgi:hypothetical protein